MRVVVCFFSQLCVKLSQSFMVIRTTALSLEEMLLSFSAIDYGELHLNILWEEPLEDRYL